MEFEVFFDGDCPLCVREIEMLRRRDQRSRIVFTDIADASFSSAELGLSQNQLMAEIHGRLVGGEIVQGVEVFRQLYSRVGFGFLVALSRLWGIRTILDFAYKVWAKNRLRMTGRCSEGVCTSG